jgi:glycogen synthase
MRLLLYSHRFHPDVGGIETVTKLLAEAFSRAGHEVVVVTQTVGPRDEDRRLAYRVVRRPSMLRQLWLVHRSEVVFHNHPNFSAVWPLLLIRRPWVVTVQTWIPRAGRTAKIKRWLLHFAHRIYISQAIANDIGLPGRVVGNPYDDQIFQFPEFSDRLKDVIFVGRLVSDKGCDLVLRALHLLKFRDSRPTLTFVGGGPEEEQLRADAQFLGVQDQVEFAGPQSGVRLAKLIQSHRVMVVPSRWAEPFGIVALEGLACGCRLVVSKQGGLPEAVGEFGLTFPNGDVSALADRLSEALAMRRPATRPCKRLADHLDRFASHRLAEIYLELATEVMEKTKI